MANAKRMFQNDSRIFVCFFQSYIGYTKKSIHYCEQHIYTFNQISTTGLAGGLLCPYKGLLPALESKDSSKSSPAATSFICQALKGLYYLLCFTGSPVNGSIYSFNVIWSYSQSDCIWFLMYS